MRPPPSAAAVTTLVTALCEWFVQLGRFGSVRFGLNAQRERDFTEPSHIHVEVRRPSRLLRQGDENWERALDHLLGSCEADPEVAR